MIIFDLDTLADDSHRQHFIYPSEDPKAWKYSPDDWRLLDKYGSPCTKKRWEPDYKAYWEACVDDKAIEAVLDAFIHLTQGEPFNHDVQIWSDRCESVRGKTLKWLMDLTGYCEDLQYWNRLLKMRPTGNTEPAHVLKEQWLEDTYEDIKWGRRSNIEFVFDSDPRSIDMWRRRGIFVFDCRQYG